MSYKHFCNTLFLFSVSILSTRERGIDLTHLLYILVPAYSNFEQKGAAVIEWLSSWLAEQGVDRPGSKPGLATWISEIGYLLLPSRDMTEKLLMRSNIPITT